jgi:hypothetical protein
MTTSTLPVICAYKAHFQRWNRNSPPSEIAEDISELEWLYPDEWSDRIETIARLTRAFGHDTADAVHQCLEDRHL